MDHNTLVTLSRFTELRKLDISENYIKRLPSDLSFLAQVSEFDLNGNPLEDVINSVDQIRDGMPGLRSLRINLHEEE